jgi:hypothetical protein
VAGGCGGNGPDIDSTVSRVDSASVEIVISSAVDRPLEWALQRLFTLGCADEGPESFSSVGIANVGADDIGNLYVMDRHANRVVVFGPDGTHLRTMGSQGGGPGELQFPIGMSVSPDGVAAVFDIGKGALVPFGPVGEALQQVQFPHSTEPGVLRHFARLEGGYMVAKGFGGPQGRDIELMGWRDDVASPDTIRLARLGLGTPEMVDFGCVHLALQPLFTPLVQWDARYDRVAVVSTAEYVVNVYASDGVHLRSIRRNLAPTPATKALAITEAGPGLRMMGGAGRCEASAEEVVEGRGFADRVPAAADVRLAPTGELWVERYEPGARPDRRSGPVDVFDATGAYLGTLPPGTPFPLLLLPGNRVAVSERDALDIERLVVMQIRREVVSSRN